MAISLKTRLKVSSVSSVQDPEGRESIRITFVEARATPPMVAMMPQNAPKGISSIVFQVQQGIQSVLPKGMTPFQFQKIVLVFMPEELEAFNIRPYPNQVYEVTITDGALQFRTVSL